MLKTHTCGELRPEHAGQQVTLAGWVNRRRDQGGLIFIDLRDRWGITQVVVDQENVPDAHKVADEARNEYVLQVVGKVHLRPEGTVNPELETGEVEVIASEIKLLNPSKTPPFYINKDEKIEEVRRMEYRYLDLRRPEYAVQHHHPPPGHQIHPRLSGRTAFCRNRNADICLKPRRKARANSSCPAATIRANFMRWPKVHSSSSNC